MVNCFAFFGGKVGWHIHGTNEVTASDLADEVLVRRRVFAFAATSCHEQTIPLKLESDVCWAKLAQLDFDDELAPLIYENVRVRDPRPFL
jgi:hypothetical protein